MHDDDHMWDWTSWWEDEEIDMSTTYTITHATDDRYEAVGGQHKAVARKECDEWVVDMYDGVDKVRTSRWHINERHGVEEDVACFFAEHGIEIDPDHGDTGIDWAD